MKKQPQDAKRQIEPFSFTEELARAVINSLSAHIVILDQNGEILETNRAWKTYSVKNGIPEDVDFKGMNYLVVCDTAEGDDALEARKVATGIRKVINRVITGFSLTILATPRTVDVGSI